MNNSIQLQIGGIDFGEWVIAMDKGGRKLKLVSDRYGVIYQRSQEFQDALLKAANDSQVTVFSDSQKTVITEPEAEAQPTVEDSNTVEEIVQEEENDLPGQSDIDAWLFGGKK